MFVLVNVISLLVIVPGSYLIASKIMTLGLRPDQPILYIILLLALGPFGAMALIGVGYLEAHISKGRYYFEKIG